MWRQMIATAAVVCVSFAPTFGQSREAEAKKYADDLKNKDAKVRLAAIKELHRLGGAQKKLIEPHMDRIYDAMKDADSKVRAEAALTVGISDPTDKKTAIGRLSKALKEDKSEEARAGIEIGLGEMGQMADDKETKDLARDALMEARKKYADSKREQKVIQAALQMINPRKKKN